MAERAAVVGQVAGILWAREPGHPVRVAVDGITSAGKTTFADEVAGAVRARGRPAARVSMDGFHHRRERRHRQGRMSGDGYYEDAYDLEGAARELLRTHTIKETARSLSISRSTLYAHMDVIVAGR